MACSSRIILTKNPLAALKDAQANHVRESWVSAMELRLVKTELQKCHQYEGVNHYATCQDLSNRYVDMLRNHRVCILLGVYGFMLTFVQVKGYKIQEKEVDS